MKCTKASATETTVLRLDSDLYLLSTQLILPSKMSFFYSIIHAKIFSLDQNKFLRSVWSHIGKFNPFVWFRTALITFLFPRRECSALCCQIQTKKRVKVAAETKIDSNSLILLTSLCVLSNWDLSVRRKLEAALCFHLFQLPTDSN